MTDFFISNKHDFKRETSNIDFNDFKSTSNFTFQKSDVESVVNSYVPTFRNEVDEKFYENFRIKKEPIRFSRNPDDDYKFNDKQFKFMKTVLIK